MDNGHRIRPRIVTIWKLFKRRPSSFLFKQKDEKQEEQELEDEDQRTHKNIIFVQKKKKSFLPLFFLTRWRWRWWHPSLPRLASSSFIIYGICFSVSWQNPEDGKDRIKFRSVLNGLNGRKEDRKKLKKKKKKYNSCFYAREEKSRQTNKGREIFEQSN